MSDIDLLPCPFCGGTPVRCENTTHAMMYWVLCGACHASPGDRKSPLEAAAAWNSRAAWAAVAHIGEPVAWVYDGPNGEHYVREHRDIAPQQLVKGGWKETPLCASPFLVRSDGATTDSFAGMRGPFSAFQSTIDPGRWYVGNGQTAYFATEIGSSGERQARIVADLLNAALVQLGTGARAQ
jgi:Lar family restriction alleviation protein